MAREKFSSRLGFILISAGCAIGIGNVWRFPYVTGNSGGAIFVLFYIMFLIIMGLPILTMEYSVGRASKLSIAKGYRKLEKLGQKWHLHAIIGIAGNYLLMMYYTIVTGWMLDYFYKMMTGKFVGADTAGVEQIFNNMLGNPGELTFWMILVVVLGFGICSLGLQKGVEKITKWMMIALIGIIMLLAVKSITLPGGMEGLKFYLVPNLDTVREVGLGNVIVAAMNQSFFTLSIGIGAMQIFGSYLDRKRTLLGETLIVEALDTFVAIFSGLIIFPACFAFGVEADSGPNLIFITLPNVFNSMAGGRIWGSLFFIFMTFAAMSTIIAVFENIISFAMDSFGWSRKKATAVNMILVAVLSMPCVLGYNLWSAFEPLKEGNTILDLEDFLVSNILLPLGSIIYILFCTSRYGWGWDKFIKEANLGDGPKFPRKLRFYCAYILPLFAAAILIYGLVTYFA